MVTEAKLKALVKELTDDGHITSKQASQVRELAMKSGLDTARKFFSEMSATETPEGAHEELQRMTAARAKSDGITVSAARMKVFNENPDLAHRASRMNGVHSLASYDGYKAPYSVWHPDGTATGGPTGFSTPNTEDGSVSWPGGKFTRPNPKDGTVAKFTPQEAHAELRRLTGERAKSGDMPESAARMLVIAENLALAARASERD